MAAPVSGVGLVFVQTIRVGLKHLAVFQEEQSHLIGWHAQQEGFRLFEDFPQADSRRQRRSYLHLRYAKRKVAKPGCPKQRRLKTSPASTAAPSRNSGAMAIWSSRQLPNPTPADALTITRSLRVEGNLAARRLAERIERACRAAV